ncbi:MAG: alpha/beta hydrolase [Gemmatimonadota bacterium]
MSRPVRIILMTLILAVAIAAGIRKWKDPEVATLDESTRAGVAGEFVALSNGVTHFEVAGPDTGRVVVLVHGFSVPAYIWDSTFHALSNDGFRVIRYDLYGRGWSDRPDVAYDGTMYDRQLDELLDSLHVVGPIDLAGLSFGGFVTAHYVASHPDRVRTLVLVDPVSDGSPLPGILRAPFLGEWIWQVTRVPGMAAGQASDFLHPEHFPGWADRYRPQMRFKGFGRALLRSAGTMGTTDFPALYSAVGKTGIPVLLIWGKQDQTVKIERSTVVRSAIPSVEFFPVDSAGHLPALEQAPLVAARWREFYAAHPR